MAYFFGPPCMQWHFIVLLVSLACFFSFRAVWYKYTYNENRPIDNGLINGIIWELLLLSFVTPQRQHETFLYTDKYTVYRVQTSMQSRPKDHKITSVTCHTDQRQIRQYSGIPHILSLQHIVWVDLYRPYFELSALQIFTFIYAKICSTLLSHWLIFNQN